MKLLYSDLKTGKTSSVELDSEKALLLLNLKIGSEIDGTAFGLTGYKLKITGGSDSSGFALDRSISGQAKIRAMRSRNMKGKEKGVHKMVTLRGNMITNDTKQVSTIITEYGSKPLDEIFPKKEKETEAKKAE
jgi:small subunit ribosomal protein S6e